MGIVSYAQNFEDVMLWRALGHIPNGFYIDVGAQHPVLDSVSKAFYEHGWRGVHVEATRMYAELLRADRQDELVLQVALSEQAGSIAFYEFPETGLSTGDQSIALKHQERGFEVQKITVPCITLADVFEQVGQRDIHWLKIDVEGMEPQVLAGWGSSAARPWVLVVESTYPLSQTETHLAWQDFVLSRGYQQVYFDGLNRYYVQTDKPEIAKHFLVPPNVFDGYSLAPTSPSMREPIKQTQEQISKLHTLVVLAENKKLEDAQLTDKLVQQLTAQHEAQQRLDIENLQHVKKLNVIISSLENQAIDSAICASDEKARLLQANMACERAHAEAIEAVKETATAQHDALINNYDSQISMLRKNLAVLENQLLAQNQELKERIQFHVNEVNYKDQITASLVQDQESLVEKLRSQIKLLQLESRQKAEEFDSMQRALNKIYTSFAWRFFAPILRLKKHVTSDRAVPNT
jgi:FkbM family methyltransferase